MKSVFPGLLLIFLLSTVCAGAQQAPAQPLPTPLTPVIPIQLPPGQPAPAQPAAPPPEQTGSVQSPTPPDYSQEAYVVEHYHQAIRFENDGTGRDQLEAQIRVVSESGVQGLGQLKVGYSALSDKLEIVYVRVRKPDGSVIAAQESAIQDLTLPDAPVYTDYHEKHISVPSLRPGDVLEYEFVRTITNPLTPGQFWTSANFSDKGIILDQQLEINVPKARQIKLKSKPGFEPKIADEGDRRIYRWTYTHLKDEAKGPAGKRGKKTRQSEDEIPTVELTTFQSWEELGAWYASLERDRRQPNDALKAKAEALVQGKPDDMAKIKALYEYVSRNVRYVSLSFGLGRYQPHAAEEVFSNGYGDCKDKNTLLAALLAAEGFQSTSVLIGSNHELDPEIPSPSQFDHVITRVPVNGKDIWLDSTNGVAPFRMLAASLRDKEALAVSPDGKTSVVRTPADLPFEAFDRTQVVGSVNETGTLKAHIAVQMRGDRELFLRFALRQMPGNRWKDFFTVLLQRSEMQGAEITGLKVSDPSDPDNPLQIDLDATASNYFDWSAPESKMSLSFLQIGLPSEGDADADNQAHPKPIKLGAAPGSSSVEVRVTMPPKYTVRLPIGVDIKRDYAQYGSSYKFEAGQLTAVRTLKLLNRELPAARREDYAAFRRAVAADEAQQIALDNKSPGMAGVGANESADSLNESAEQALKNNNYQLAVSLLQRVVKLEPRHKMAWDQLGRGYLALNQNDQAIEAFKKQIEVDAYHQYAYNDLGVAYERELKFDQAIQQFQKQIEINPLDPSAHASLGQAYVTQKKFAEAVPELEKAVTLQPNNPVLLISLGQSYIATGETAKGMAQFEKAISVSPSPLIWNNIAYSLAEQNVQLDRAEKYADAAINALQTQLRDVRLDSLRFQDLGAALFLYNIWDTKGWIEFKRGDFDLAEQYIDAAWQASGSGTIGEHLAEIHEKQGKRERAIHEYILSLAGDSPSDSARARLSALGAGKGLDHKVDEARRELQRQRTIPLQTSGRGSADFFLLLSPGKVEKVKFIKGSEELKGLANLLEKTDVGMKFPANAEVRVVRRGVVTCGMPTAPVAAASGKGSTPPAAAAGPPPQGPVEPCSVELLPAQAVRTLD